MDSARVITGDCVDVMATMPAASADLIFCDPPYNLGKVYGTHHNDRMPESDYLAWCEQWIGAAVRLLTPTGTLWLINDAKWVAEMPRLLKAAGLHIRLRQLYRGALDAEG